MVEPAIALSVLLVALNNIRPVFVRGAWQVVFGFGLIHGFGFASVLADLGLPDAALIPTLAAFNLGIEAGQLVIVALLLPALHALRGLRVYRQAVMPALSTIIAIVAAVWFLQRV
ncbi:MAG: HupE/UreJ family protein [Burkholderiaceae bacterium]